MHSADFSMKCYFCQQDIPKECIDKFGFSTGEVLLWIGNCPHCLKECDIKSITVTNKEWKPVAAHLYATRGAQQFHFLFHLNEDYFSVKWVNHPTLGPQEIYRVEFLPNVNPKNVNEKLSTLLTFL